MTRLASLGIAISFAACGNPGVSPDRSPDATDSGSDSGSGSGSDAAGSNVNLGGGPSTYTAPTDTAAHSYSALAAPAENAPTTDPDFIHTSSGGICASDQTCFVRATGPELWSQISSQFQAVTGTVGFATESGSVFNTWDADDSHFVFGANAGNQSVIMNFDPTTGAVALNTVAPHTITAGTGLLHFSKTEAHVVYGYPNLSTMDVTDSTQTVNQIVDLTALCNFPITTTITGGGWDSTPDNTGAGKDSRYASYIGPQNTAELAVVYDRPTNTCYWYDTKLDSMGGSAGAPTCTACGGFTGTIHGLGISADGKYADISDNGVGVVSWAIGTTTVVHMPEFDTAGHRVVGQHTMMAGPSSAMNAWWVADLATPTTASWGEPRLSGLTDQHNGWVNVNATDSNPMYTLAYPNGSNGACQDATDPVGTNEPQMVATDGSNVTYRFMHARKNVCLDDDWFYHEVSGNVSRSGRFAMFSSDWDGTLGQFTIQGVEHYRDDVFIVELR